MQPTMVLDDYENRVASGELRADALQHRVATHLDRLQQALESQQNGGWLAGLRRKKTQIAGRSIYVWGSVGRGKTLLMDLLFASVTGVSKRRVHFHSFMQDVHSRLLEIRKKPDVNDAISAVGKDLAAETRLLCLDEMQIADIADAMIVGRLVEALLDAGTTIVTTSNSPPSGLYKDGLNRALFLPFIKLLEEKFDVLAMEGPTDYRLGRIKAHETFLTPIGPEADELVQNLWQRLTETETGKADSLVVNGRTLEIPQEARGCARFSFAELCEAPLGPADYLAIARNYQVVFVERIPALSPENRNEAKRFVLLIDALYDGHVRLIASSAKPPDGIYPSGDHKFEFARTISRLQEMQSATWWGKRIAET